MHEDVVHIYQCFADWFRSLRGTHRGHLKRIQTKREDSFPERVVDKALVKKWASELANHPKFGATRSGDQREFLLETIAGSEIDGLPVGRHPG